MQNSKLLTLLLLIFAIKKTLKFQLMCYGSKYPCK